jgi:Heparinase II/III-like protein/Heparinase II/III N-terminus
MSPPEVRWRLEDYAKKWTWRAQQVRPGSNAEALPRRGRRPSLRDPHPPRFSATLDARALQEVPLAARDDVLAAADEVMAGSRALLGAVRQDMEDPDWFFDPVTGRSAPSSDYCFWIDHRSEAVTGNVKQIWELSRLQHITVLSAAYALSGDERYAERAAAHLRSWWAQNTFLSGVHWTSGIEVGLRLITWVWARRLLEDWPGVYDLFEHNSDAVTQIWWHQRYLARFQSRGSSANNHVIAEAAGQLIAGLAFNWFDESEAWARAASTLLEREITNNTFASGVNREMAFEYHGFVAELGLLAAVEADRAQRPLSEQTWEVLCRMVDVVAATVDVKLHPPRQGDGDDGKALLLGHADFNRWESLLALGAQLFGAPAWWPKCTPEVSSTLIASLGKCRNGFERPFRRPCHFGDAGLTIMRAVPSEEVEIWCRCDAGPHGFLSIAAHAHADALAIEVRYNGTEILADPGTYCYHGQPSWRDYFRSTLGHNTIELGRQDQSTSGGPTLWTRHARSRLVELGLDEDGEAETWSAEHDGYATLDPPARHNRTVRLFKEERQIQIRDRVESRGRHSMRIAFHLGPDVHVESSHEGVLELSWTAARGGHQQAMLYLPKGLDWSLTKGSTSPVLGWYSARFGEKQPSTTILGEGTCAGLTELETVLHFCS